MVEKTGLEAELSVTDIITKTGTRGSKINLDVLVTLSNHDEFSRVVHVADSDCAHFWQLLDEDHKEVLRGRPTTKSAKTKSGLHPSFTATIPPEHPLNSTHKVTIDLNKLKHGGSYTLRWVAWDQHPVEQEITIPARPKLAQPARAKPLAKPPAKPRARPRAKGRARAR